MHPYGATGLPLSIGEKLGCAWSWGRVGELAAGQAVQGAAQVTTTCRGAMRPRGVWCGDSLSLKRIGQLHFRTLHLGALDCKFGCCNINAMRAFQKEQEVK